MRTNEAVWQDKYKRWRIQVQVNGKRKSFYSSKAGKRGKIAAEKKADAWIANGDAKDMPFDELAASYLAHLRTANGTAHKRREGEVIRLYLPWQGRKVSGLTNLDYQEAIDACVEGREKPLSARTCGHVRTTIKGLYNHARMAGVKMAEPFGLTIPTGATKKERQILQPEDIQTLFDPSLDKYYYIHFCRFVVLTGLRPGEVCGLQNEDLKGNILTIRRAKNYRDEYTNGKNKNARRTIVLPALALKAVQDHRSEQNRRSITTPYLFCNINGEACRQNAVYKGWQSIRKCGKISAASMYELRHTMISVCKAQVPLALLKRTVGHSESMDTIGTYGHEVDGELQLVASLIDTAFDEVMRYKVRYKTQNTEENRDVAAASQAVNAGSIPVTRSKK